MKTLWIGLFAGLASLPVWGEDLDLTVGSIHPPVGYQIYVQGPSKGIYKGSIAEGARIINFEIGKGNSYIERDLAVVWSRNQESRGQRFEIQLLEDANHQQFARVTINSTTPEQFPLSYPVVFLAPIKGESESEGVIADIVATAMSYRPFTPQSEPLDWDAIRNQPASVAILNMKPVDFKIGGGKQAWVRIPGKLREFRTQIFVADGTTNGIADFIITSSGYALLVCNYSYQGNKSGDWTGDRWSKTQFMENGWRLVTAEEIDGSLICIQNRPYSIFIKYLKKGEHGRLRCNKYVAPFFILPTNEPTDYVPEEVNAEPAATKIGFGHMDTVAPLLNVDPWDRSTKKIRVPTGLVVERDNDSISLVTTESEFKEIEVTVGKNMLIGSRFEMSGNHEKVLTPMRSGMPIPEHEWITIEEHEAPKQIRVRVYWFETDLPEQHFWSPESSPNFKILWEDTLVTDID